ncbi:MAG: right-handed parallel beta-helix repeat-containing protein [Fuerstiella sp.]
MNTKRVFASLCLAASSCALFTAASVSVGDQPGVVRLTAGQQNSPPPLPAPPAREFSSGASGPTSGGMASDAGTASMADLSYPGGGAPVQSSPVEGVPMDGGFTDPSTYDPYFQPSGGATESPVLGRMLAPNNPLFGPSVTFESNFEDGLGFSSAFHRANVRVPYHVVPGSSVLIADLSTSVTNQGNYAHNFGAIWRNFDASRNRIFGWNAYFDLDDGQGNTDWQRVGFGVESLGRYLDFRANGYVVTGDDSFLLSDTLIGDLVLSGNGAFQVRNQTRENVYSGFDAETGGPLPGLGRRGINGYVGGYYLNNDTGFESVGVSARVEALITESVTANFRYTNDDTFGSNAYVSIAYEIPSYRQRAIFQPRQSVQSRLADPVVRSSRIHSNIDDVNALNAIQNEKTNRAFRLAYVDPNSSVEGTGTLEDPFGSLQLLAVNNDPTIDIIRVVPNADDSGTNLTVNGGLQLFDDQQLVSSVQDFRLFTNDDGLDFVIPGTPTLSGLGPLVSNPTNGPGGSVIQLANWNTVHGLRIDGANAAGTAFGNGISNPLPFEDVAILNNTFTNYVTAIDLQNASGDIEISGNTIVGTTGVAENGLLISTGNGSITNLLIQQNTVSNNSTTGIQVTVAQDATLNADNTTGFNGVGNSAIQATGIVDNVVTNGGQGIEVLAQQDSEVFLVAENNTSTGNTANGFFARADGGLFNLRSLRGNTFSDNGENGAFLNYRNGGRFLAVSEDANGDGVPDAAEVGSNNILDQGIVSNTFNGNLIAGICIVGEDDATGEFDIGGPTEELGNELIGNQGGGIVADLQDTATGQIDAIFNTISADPLTAQVTPALTLVLDFIEPGQNVTDTFFGGQFGDFDVTGFGFDQGDFGLITNSVLDRVTTQFQQIPTVGQDSRSPIPDGQQLAIDFVIGDIGDVPSNGATEFYTAVIGENTSPPAGVLGVATLAAIRDATGAGPNFGFVNGDITSNIYSNSIAQVGGVQGNLDATVNILSNVISHEVGHSLSLNHVSVAGSVTPSGVAPILGTGDLDLTNADLISPLEFSFSGVDGENGDAPSQNVAQLLSALGSRNAVSPGLSGEGILVTANGSARLLPSTFTNNTITGNGGSGLSVYVSENAVAEGVTIQTNTITNNGGRGIDFSSTGPNSQIIADGTIGGSGINTIQGRTFSQGNTISNNTLDGIRAFAEDNGTILGNAINNQIQQNGGNGIALLTENGGIVDFGTPASNRLIAGNSITGNGEVGILLSSNATANSESQIDAVIQGNDISSNGAGGILTELSGTNSVPPALPVNAENNIVNLTVGGTDLEANTINANSDFGIGINATGTSLVNFEIRNQEITNTVDGPNPLFGGDGISIRRADAALLQGVIESVTATGNVGNGLNIETQGNNQDDPTQPLTGTVNTVEWLNSNFSNNGANGARFRTRGDSLLIADGVGNVVSDNAANGILVQTSENSEFGDSTGALLPPGRRVVFDGTTATGNAQDGLNILTQDDSRALIEVTSNRAAGSTAAHAALNTDGDSSFSDNGEDGIHITTSDNSIADILLTSGTGQTTLSNNGTIAGGNGLRVDADDASQSLVRAELLDIFGNISGATENAANFGNGVLDPGEDVNRNGILDTNLAAAGGIGIGGEDGTNDDLDTEDGDGIQFNAFAQADATLIVGGVGRGNSIQNNGDDGIAITATGNGGLRPNITIVGNSIGGLRDGIQAGNGGDGVSVNVFGGTIAAAPGTSPVNGVTQSGPTLQFVLEDNVVTNNAQRGVNLLLTGAAGERDRENGNATFDPGRFTLTNNIINSNGTEGLFFRADAELNQSRAVLLPNFPFPNPPNNPANQRPLAAAFYNPNLPEFQANNIGSLAGQSAIASVAPDGATAFLNLRTVQNSFLTVENNTVQNNGVGGVTGEGVVISVGTGSFLAADVRDNAFGGNLEEDFRTESFLSFGQTSTSIDVQGDGTFDTVFLDDSAQLDLRFFGNTGNQIAISSDGATFTNADPLKQLVLLGGVTDRDAAFFQVDNGINLNVLGNDFISSGITQQVDVAFQGGGFNLRNAADPLFPNLLFAPFLP